MRVVIDAPVSQYQISTALDLTLSQMPGVGTRVTATIQISRETLTLLPRTAIGICWPLRAVLPFAASFV